MFRDLKDICNLASNNLEQLLHSTEVTGSIEPFISARMSKQAMLVYVSLLKY
jgi:hypothetical protein